jgi:hypothetical protein
MTIETICTGCGKRLRVGEEHAGKLARCPQCQTTYTVPQLAPAGSLAASFPGKPAVSDAWQLRTGDGLTYGPVTKAELDGWLAEGRITPQSQILQTGAEQWKWAGEVYPQLNSGFPATSISKTNARPVNSPFGELPSGTDNPFADNTAPVANPYSPQGMSYTPGAGYSPITGRYLQPHRGGLILALSIVGIFSSCWILTIVGFIMGIVDLGAMNAGRMDPSGRGLTIAGIVISSICFAVIALIVVISVLG